MCQLTLTNLGSARLNSLHTYNSLLTNSWTSHKDGFGFYDINSGITKSRLQPAVCVNLGELLRDKIKGTDPIISHVRLASGGWSNKIIDDKNSHPFEQETLILAHNGTLEARDPELEKEERFKDKIDTEMFSILLDEKYKENKDIAKSLHEVYSLFYGKFAFMIYSKIDNNFYLARGSSADLWFTGVYLSNKDPNKMESLGFIVNTSTEDLRKAIFITSNHADMFMKTRLDWDAKFELLTENSIFILNKKTNLLDKIGEVKQESKPYVYQSYPQQKEVNKNIINIPSVNSKNGSKDTRSNNGIVIYDLKGNPIVNTPPDPLLGEVLNFMWRFNLEIRDIDELLYHTLGFPLLYCTGVEIETFLQFVVPELEERSGEQKNIKKAWDSLKNKSLLSGEELISKYGLQFPYILSDISEIRRIKKEEYNHRGKDIYEDDDTTPFGPG